MCWADRISMLVAAAAIVATLGVGTCSTNARFNDVNARFNDVNARFNDVNRRIDDLQSEIRGLRDDLQADIRELQDDLQADIRELRSLVIEAIKDDTPADAAADN